ncbi:MAG TPA: glycosyltransferase family 2 protein [Candidatus Saccharimonadales bacterium]|nr:glycosyltransferase family 2 protein [Candidatus Saccharimonadales bacterium]
MRNGRLLHHAKRLLPPGTRRHRIARKLYNKLRHRTISPASDVITYAAWVKNCEPKVWVPAGRKYKRRPLISVVVPTYNTPEKYLLPLIESVREQLYDRWQLCIADGSTDAARAAAIKAACAADDRIVYHAVGKNLGIVGNTNEALQLAKGDFVGFLDHDDTLSPHALLEVVDALNKQPQTDIFYSDEDKISDDGRVRSLPFFKPGWSPQLLEGVNYMTHFFVIRRSVIEAIGPLTAGYDGSQDFEFILRATDHTQAIVHIPKILYHWRLAEGSTSGPITNKNYANDAGLKALRDHIRRQGIKATVLEREDLPTNYHVRYDVPKDAKASIIIPFKDKADLLKACVGSILAKTTYKQYEIILVSNNSTEQATHDYLATLKHNKKITIVYHDQPFNYSQVNNVGRRHATGDYLVLLNNDTEVITGEWLGELLGVAAQPWAGAVGPLLFYPTNKIQHAGVVLGMMSMAGHVFRMLPEDAITPYGRPRWPRNCLAVTGACLAVKASKYDEVGGLDEQFVVAGQDVAFNISLYEKGYRNVYWPFAKLYHYESVSVGSYSKAPVGDYNHSLDYYRPYLNGRDPYFNPNLALDNEQIALRSSYE